MEGTTVKGVFVETKQGTRAVMANVVIDCTGDADIVARSGAPVDNGNSMVRSGCYFAIANADVDTFKKEVINREVPEEDFQWVEKHDHRKAYGGHARYLIRYLRNAHEAGEPFQFCRETDFGYIAADHGLFWGVSGFSVDDPHRLEKYGILGGIMGLRNSPDQKYLQDTGDSVTMTGVEVATRKYVVEWAKFVKKWVPGCEKSYLHYIGQYYHGRGGRSMQPSYQLTKDDVENDARFDDMVFQGHHGLLHADKVKTPYRLWDVLQDYRHTFEWPYRQFLPRNVEGLLCAGRASIVQPPVLRQRWQMLMTGEIAGRAAAKAVNSGVLPRNIDVHDLRKSLYNKGFPMTDDPSRFGELGLRT